MDLAEECERLREELRQLRELFCGPIPLLCDVGLTRHESRLLGALYRTPGIVTRDAIQAALHGSDYLVKSPKAIDVYVGRVKRKLRPLGVEVRTIRGVGYRLTDESRAIIARLVADKPRQVAHGRRNTKLSS
jgi:DNA-binding response OmpR family regulator